MFKHVHMGPTDTPLSDEDAPLVVASRAGDAAAFEQLVSRYDRKLFRIAYHIVHNADDARDVVQETFIKVFQNIGRFQSQAKFSTWLYRIVVNQSLMEVRTKRRRPVPERLSLNDDEQEDRLPIDLSDWRPNPEETIHRISAAGIAHPIVARVAAGTLRGFCDARYREAIIARDRRGTGLNSVGCKDTITAGKALPARAAQCTLQTRSRPEGSSNLDTARRDGRATRACRCPPSCFCMNVKRVAHLASHKSRGDNFYKTRRNFIKRNKLFS